MSIKKIITILGLICFGCAAAEFTTLLKKKEHTDNGNFDFAMMKHMPSGRQFFAYGICKLSDSSDSTECNIFRESLNGKNNGSSCLVSLNGNASALTLHDFDDDKVIVYWYDANDKLPNYYLRFTIVQFSNCSTAEARIRYDLDALRNFNYGRSLGTILAKGEKFTVAVDNLGLFGNNIDEQTFDVNGRPIGNAVNWLKPLNKAAIIAIDTFKNDNNVILELDVNNNRSRFSILNDYGFKVLNISKFKDITTAHYDVSTAHDTLRHCLLMEPSSKIDCDTFDAKGNSISRNTLNLNHNPVKLTVYNLVDGGFFIITATASSKTSEKLFYISKFSADGKLNATMELPGFKCNGDQIFVIPYENEKDLQCVMRICTNNKNDFDALIKCFSNEDVV